MIDIEKVSVSGSDFESIWMDVVRLYHATWQQWEREPESAMRARVVSRADMLVVGRKEQRIVGFYMLSYPPHHQWAVLRHMAVDKLCRGRGFGGLLCQDAKTRFASINSRTQYLFLEAQARQRVWYAGHGFDALSLAYEAPLEAPGQTLPMSLMWHGASPASPSQDIVRRLVIDLYTRGYGVPLGDDRFMDQIQRLRAWAPA